MTSSLASSDFMEQIKQEEVKCRREHILGVWGRGGGVVTAAECNMLTPPFPWRRQLGFQDSTEDYVETAGLGSLAFIFPRFLGVLGHPPTLLGSP